VPKIIKRSWLNEIHFDYGWSNNGDDGHYSNNTTVTVLIPGEAAHQNEMMSPTVTE
jgi:archaellum component FlaG (FlaF/FlaG flagellin family)